MEHVYHPDIGIERDETAGQGVSVLFDRGSGTPIHVHLTQEEAMRVVRHIIGVLDGIAREKT